MQTCFHLFHIILLYVLLRYKRSATFILCTQHKAVECS